MNEQLFGFMYHVTVKGFGESNIFACDGAKVRYFNALRKFLPQTNVSILSTVCLMNCIQFIFYDTTPADIGYFMKYVNSSFAKYLALTDASRHLSINKPYSVKQINNTVELTDLFFYINNLPVKCDMVDRPELYKWSSYRMYKGLYWDYSDIIDDRKYNFFIEHLSQLDLP